MDVREGREVEGGVLCVLLVEGFRVQVPLIGGVGICEVLEPLTEEVRGIAVKGVSFGDVEGVGGGGGGENGVRESGFSEG